MRKSLVQISGFLISTVGWMLVSVTLALEYWKVHYVGGRGGSWMIKASWYWADLWKECVTDTSSVSDCKEYDIMWDLTPYVQAVRGLLLSSMMLGFVAAVLCFFGMDCTYIGGSEENKRRILLSGAAFHFTGGVSALAAYCLYTNRIIRNAFAPTVDRSVIRYGIGTPIFVGLIGTFFIVLGSVLYAVTLISTPSGPAPAIRFSDAPPSYSRRSASKSPYTSAYYAPSRPSIRLGPTSPTSQASAEKMSTRDTFV